MLARYISQRLFTCGYITTQQMHVSRRTYHKASSLFPKYAVPLTKEKSSKENSCRSQEFMHQLNLLHVSAPGTFCMSPTLTRSLEKLHRVIDKEMKAIGGQKVTLPCLALGKDWKVSRRWNEMGSELFKLTDRHDQEYCLAPTHEEAITKYVASFGGLYYRSLPIMLYQIGRKYRDEMRPKHGLLRCREFEMKDLYSFDQDLTHAQKSYESVTSAYAAIMRRLDLDYVRVAASSGSMGGSVSHEFHLLSDIGEDTLFRCSNCGDSFNQELLEEAENQGRKFTCNDKNVECDFMKMPAIEICHSFILGTKYSDVFKAKYADQNGKLQSLYMGCYGIGVTRLLAAAMEILSQGSCVKWPRVIAPYQIFVIPETRLDGSEEVHKKADYLCKQFTRFQHLQDEVVMSDNRKHSIGKRVLLAQFLGIPHIVVVNNACLEKGAKYEYIDVYNDRTSFLTEHELMGLFSDLDTVTLC